MLNPLNFIHERNTMRLQNPIKMSHRNRISWLRPFCLAIVLMVSQTVVGSADIVLSVDSSGATNVDLGLAGPGKSIDIFISQQAGSTDRLFGILAFLRVDAGRIPGAIGVETSNNESGRVGGTTGSAGYFGESNLSVSTINKVDDRFVVINQEMTNAAQPVPNDPTRTRWLTLNLDTTGLDGTFGITMDDNNTFISSNPPFPSFVPRAPNNALTFTVTAIPEPSSLAVLAALGGVSCLIRRRRGAICG